MYTVLDKQCIVYLLLPLVLVITLTPLVNTMYNEHLGYTGLRYPFKRSMNYTVLYTLFKPVKIHDYSYVFIILDAQETSPKGIYAYGFYIEKDPDINGLSIYCIAGSQNRWYKLVDTKSIDREVELSMVIDRSLHIVKCRYCNVSKTIENVTIKEYDGVNTIVASLDNSFKPEITVEKLYVVETNNKTIADSIYKELSNLRRYNNTVNILVEKEKITVKPGKTTPAIQPGTTLVVNQPQPGIPLETILITIPAIAVLAILVIIFLFKRKK